MKKEKSTKIVKVMETNAEREKESTTRIFMEDHEEQFLERARFLSDVCKRNSFEGNLPLFTMKDSHMQFLYDGIGPDWEWSVVRGICKHMKDIFAPAAFLQDVLYKTCHDRSEASFRLVNRQFYHNCIKCAKMNYGWYDLRRYFAYRSARVLYQACESDGLESWNRYSIRIEFKEK